MSNVNVISIFRPKIEAMKDELTVHSLPVAYLCVKFGANAFVELLVAGQIEIDDSSMVSFVAGEK